MHQESVYSLQLGASLSPCYRRLSVGRERERLACLPGGKQKPADSGTSHASHVLHRSLCKWWIDLAGWALRLALLPLALPADKPARWCPLGKCCPVLSSHGLSRRFLLKVDGPLRCVRCFLSCQMWGCPLAPQLLASGPLLLSVWWCFVLLEPSVFAAACMAPLQGAEIDWCKRFWMATSPLQDPLWLSQRAGQRNGCLFHFRSTTLLSCAVTLQLVWLAGARLHAGRSAVPMCWY